MSWIGERRLPAWLFRLPAKTNLPVRECSQSLRYNRQTPAVILEKNPKQSAATLVWRDGCREVRLLMGQRNRANAPEYSLTSSDLGFTEGQSACRRSSPSEAGDCWLWCITRYLHRRSPRARR